MFILQPSQRRAIFPYSDVKRAVSRPQHRLRCHVRCAVRQAGGLRLGLAKRASGAGSGTFSRVPFRLIPSKPPYTAVGECRKNVDRCTFGARSRRSPHTRRPDMRAFLLSLESACNRHVVNNIYRPPPSTPLCTYHTTDTPAGTGPRVVRSALRSALANTPSAVPEVDTSEADCSPEYWTGSRRGPTAAWCAGPKSHGRNDGL